MRVYVRGFGAFIQFHVALVSGQAQVQMDWSLLGYPTIPSWRIKLETKEGVCFKVNGQHIKIYFGHAESANKVIEAYHLDEI